MAGNLGDRMCGRYVINAEPDDLAGYFGVDHVMTERLEPSYNVAPTDPVYAVAEHRGSRQLGSFRWGLIPHWSTDRKGPLNINARAETVATKPAFRDSVRRKRCLLPATGFFEWGHTGVGKHPYFVRMADDSPMAFAGIWAAWRDPETGEWIRSAAIITTAANKGLSPIHTRMPVILEPDHWDLWLDRDIRSAGAVEPLLGPLADSKLTWYPVSRQVNSVRNNLPTNISPLSRLESIDSLDA
ncbi:MAG: SOS response-associated peptidase [bacterium]|nr:SOS response-associated peptidase [bacterium]